jgi:hypothetical protein
MTSIRKTTGVVLAAAAATLFLSGAVAGPTAFADEAKVKCAGINSCKGTSACKTADNPGGPGQNSCKGQGMVETTQAECEAQGGQILS